MQSSAVNESQLVIDSHQESAHHGHPDHRMFGVILFLIADSMTFIGFFAAFLIYRAIMPEWPPRRHSRTRTTSPNYQHIHSSYK